MTSALDIFTISKTLFTYLSMEVVADPSLWVFPIQIAWFVSCNNTLYHQLSGALTIHLVEAYPLATGQEEAFQGWAVLVAFLVSIQGEACSCCEEVCLKVLHFD